MSVMLFLLLLLSVCSAGMLDLVNRARQQAGLPPLVTSDSLIQASEQHCAHQVAIDTMTHDDPNPPVNRIQSAGYNNLQAWAENVAETQGTDEVGVMDMWMSSPGHRENILGNYVQLGWAVKQGRRGNYYWTQMFARPFGQATNGLSAKVTSEAKPAVQPPPPMKIQADCDNDDGKVPMRFWRGARH